jgi:hypothetical protein
MNPSKMLKVMPKQVAVYTGETVFELLIENPKILSKPIVD